MAPALALPLLLVSVVVTLAAARQFARKLDEVGARLGLPETLLGLLTALAADAPEISSALISLAKGASAASFGVVVGSNVFNLAAMIGLSGILAGTVHIRREALWLEGTVVLLATVVVGALVLGGISPLLAAVALGVTVVPYLLVLAGLADRLPLPTRVQRALKLALGARAHAAATAGPRQDVEHAAAWHTATLLLGAVALVLLGSWGMVEAALALGGRWGLSTAFIGVLVLGPLTSIPNAATGVRLGLADRGAALVSETFNSNAINLVAGVSLPALFVSVVRPSGHLVFELVWLLLATTVTLALLAQRRGIGRRGALALIGLYFAFVAVEALTT